MNDSAVLHEILIKLGSIEAGQTQLRRDFDQEKGYSRDSRRVVHEKLDGVSDRLSEVEASIRVASEVADQTSERIDAVNGELAKRITAIGTRIDKDVDPTVNDFKRMRNVGLTVVGVIAFGGTAFGVSMQWWSEQFIQTVRSLLRIP